VGMQDATRWMNRPFGMRDVYPQQARRRRQLENRLLNFFESSGFQLVSCGVFEYVDTLLRGRSREETANWVQLFDTSGRAMALRPDLTPSIARMAAPLLQRGEEEISWCYAERVYRRAHESSAFTSAGTRAAESTQVGVEWLGWPQQTPASTPGTSSLAVAVDVRTLALCVNALRHLGLRNWQLVVGHAGFTPAFLEASGISKDVVERMLPLLAAGDYVGFRQALALEFRNAHAVLDELSQLNPYQPSTLSPALRKRLAGEYADSSSRVAARTAELTLDGPSSNTAADVPSSGQAAGRSALDEWDKLVSLAHSLVGLGMAEGIAFDLTLCRNLTYYTGIVFEVFAEGVGAPIALGGRYDDLLGHFASAAPAIGFAFEIEGLMALPVTWEEAQYSC